MIPSPELESLFQNDEPKNVLVGNYVKYFNQRRFSKAKSFLMTLSVLDDSWIIKIELFKIAKFQSDFYQGAEHFTNFFINSNFLNNQNLDDESRTFFENEMKRILYSIQDRWLFSFNLSQNVFKTFFDTVLNEIADGINERLFYQQVWDILEEEKQAECLKKICELSQNVPYFLIDIYVYIICNYRVEEIDFDINLFNKTMELMLKDENDELKTVLGLKYLHSVLPITLRLTTSNPDFKAELFRGLKWIFQLKLNRDDEEREKDLDVKMFEILKVIDEIKKTKVFKSDTEMDIDYVSNSILKYLGMSQKSLDEPAIFFALMIITIFVIKFYIKTRNLTVWIKVNTENRPITGKRRKTTKNAELYSTDSEINVNFALSQNFYGKFFSQLRTILKNQLGINLKNNFNLFQFEICQCIQNEKYLDAIQMLRQTKFTNFTEFECLKCCLEYLSLRNSDRMADHVAVLIRYIVQILNLLSSESLMITLEENEQKEQKIDNILDYFESSNSQILFFYPTLKNIISILVHTLINLFEESNKSDVLIGHTIILSQFEWPRFRPALLRMMELIKKNRKFDYPLFSQNIFVPDILGEFQRLLIAMPNISLRLEKKETNKPDENQNSFDFYSRLFIMTLNSKSLKSDKQVTRYIGQFIGRIAGDIENLSTSSTDPSD